MHSSALAKACTDHLVQGATVAIMAGTAGAATLGASPEEKEPVQRKPKKQPEMQ